MIFSANKIPVECFEGNKDFIYDNAHEIQIQKGMDAFISESFPFLYSLFGLSVELFHSQL